MRTFFSKNKLTVLIVILACGIIASATLWLTWSARREESLRFTMYAPTVLLDGIKITNHRVVEVSSPNRTYRHLIFTTNNSDFSINEIKSTPEEYRDNLYNCGTKMESSTCKVLTSPDGQSYHIRTSLDRDQQPFSQTIMWLRGSTSLWIDLSDKQVTSYADESWGKIIDGFEGVDYSNEPIEQIVARGGG